MAQFHTFTQPTEQDIYYHDEFLKLASEHANFHDLTDLKPWRTSVAGLTRLRAGACAGNCAGPHGFSRLYLWTGQNDQR
jgi:hypothetical protein